MLVFTVDIDPVAKGRPRFVRRGRFVHTFTPQKTRSFENELIEKTKKYTPKSPLEGPLSLLLTFHMPIPKSLRGVQGDPHTKKPDLDNLIKACVDPLNGRFWKDDAQIVNLLAFKLYSDTPRIEYRIVGFGEEVPPLPKATGGPYLAD